MGEAASLPDKPAERPADAELGEPMPKQGSDELTPDSKVQSAVRKLAEKPETLMQIMATGMTSIGNPLLEKMTGEHVSQVIDLATKHDERQADLLTRGQHNEHTQWILSAIIGCAAFAVVIVLVILILVLFKDRVEVLAPALTGISGVLGGFLGGWGLGSRR